tara:strand:- start:5505 stop:5981 length:477 start_codon:yes stop_codon:yes gene_type:complete
MSAGVQIFIDGDACPVKDEIYRVAVRHGVPAVLVSNSYIRMPEHALLSRQIVTDGFDAADDWIAERAHAKSVVITADILLADRCLKAGAKVIGTTGKPFTDDSIGAAVATRAILADLRVGISETGTPRAGGPAPFTKADRSRFLSALDEALVKLKRLP